MITIKNASIFTSKSNSKLIVPAEPFKDQDRCTHVRFHEDHLELCEGTRSVARIDAPIAPAGPIYLAEVDEVQAVKGSRELKIL